MNNELIELIAYNPVFNDILGLHIPNKKIYYSKGGLIAHLKKATIKIVCNMYSGCLK